MAEHARHSAVPAPAREPVSAGAPWRSRLATLGVCVLALIVIAAAATVLIDHYSPAPAPSSSATDTATEPTTDRSSDTSALFIGDSYTAAQANPSGTGYPCLTATALDWNCNIAAQPGTGYINGGPDHRIPRIIGALEVDSTSLIERLPRLRTKFDADIVVLDAGRNDVGFDAVDVGNAFLSTLDQTQQTWPNARIVVIAPWFLASPAIVIDPGTGPIGVGAYLLGLMRAQPRFDPVTFIDPGALGWFQNEDTFPLRDLDGIHPTDRAHRVIAEKLIPALLANGFGQRQ
ncbi:SGNH/GDSL hydrolase family protein [Rhodococcus ruber]|uniref:SGNH/GDSL hydrolase family protein n=1 Tax=Rhodococcus ruber TaxID=1830 RepID=A0ABT4MDF6_9NOCA|nr:SGNH/GDSL hydrolase family protein [Rhodococcus ruber]MCZ4518090.1 SGNH/GDSL hydrolase family protein [Rhodococcus ruber]